MYHVGLCESAGIRRGSCCCLCQSHLGGSIKFSSPNYNSFLVPDGGGEDRDPCVYSEQGGPVMPAPSPLRPLVQRLLGYTQSTRGDTLLGLQEPSCGTAGAPAYGKVVTRAWDCSFRLPWLPPASRHESCSTLSMAVNSVVS